MAKARLDSWKSIAEYLKRSPRTVQRWHADLGLPIRRFGAGKGPVYANSDELDAWLSGFTEDGGEDSGAGELLAARKQRSSDLTVQANELWELRTENNLPTIVALYRAAIDQNPLDGPAFAGMANALILAALTGAMRSSAAYSRAAEALMRAQRLGMETDDARCAAAWLQMVYERKWKRARDGFDMVLSRQPGSAHALAGRALLNIAEGRVPAALKCLDEAWKKNFLASVSGALAAWAQYLTGDFTAALETVSQSRYCGEFGPLSAAVEALVLTQSGPVAVNLGRIEELAKTQPSNPVLKGALGYAYAACDRAAMARDMLRDLATAAGDSQYAAAIALIGLGEAQSAIARLDIAYAEGSLWSLGFRYDPILQLLRDDPRFASRLRRLGHTG